MKTLGFVIIALAVPVVGWLLGWLDDRDQGRLQRMIDMEQAYRHDRWMAANEYDPQQTSEVTQ